MENVQTMLNEIDMTPRLTKTGKIRKEFNEKRERYFLVVKMQGDFDEDKNELIKLWCRNSGFTVYSLNIVWNQEFQSVESYECKNDKTFKSCPNMPKSLRKSQAVRTGNIADLLSLYLETHCDAISASEFTVKQYFRRFKTV